VHLPPRRAHAATLVAMLPTIALAAAWLLLFRPVTLGGPAGYVIVAGHSMEPTFVTGDLAITQRHSSYGVGDVVAFETDGGVVIHRIIGGDPGTGYEVRGDSRALSDPWRPRPETIIGSVWFTVPGAGHLLALLRQPAVLAIIAAAIAFFLAFTAGPVRLPGRTSSPSMAAGAPAVPQGPEAAS
jgi:signal peptidase